MGGKQCKPLAEDDFNRNAASSTPTAHKAHFYFIGIVQIDGVDIGIWYYNSRWADQERDRKVVPRSSPPRSNKKHNTRNYLQFNVQKVFPIRNDWWIEFDANTTNANYNTCYLKILKINKPF